MTTLQVTCVCGATAIELRDVSPATVTRVSCACDGCRGFAERMDKHDLLDRYGATHKFQISPAQARLVRGRERLTGMQQTKGGAMRWYARCCDTPMILTLEQRGVPFAAFDVERVGLPEAERDAVLGPILARVNHRIPRGDPKPDGMGAVPLARLLGTLAPRMIGWWWRGDAKKALVTDEEGAWWPEVERLWESVVEL